MSTRGSMSIMGLFNLGGSGYEYYRNMETITTMALIFGLLATVLSFILIIPEKKRQNLNGFFKFAHDVFNFRGLIIEVILKALYVFATLYGILYGVLSIFFGGEFLACLVVIIFYPIVIRIFFEAMMMLILLVKNVIAINNKLTDKTGGQKNADVFEMNYQQPKPEAPQQPVYQQPAPAAAPVFCTNCGTSVPEESAFCPLCGNKVR